MGPAASAKPRNFRGLGKSSDVASQSSPPHLSRGLRKFHLTAVYSWPSFVLRPGRLNEAQDRAKQFRPYRRFASKGMGSKASLTLITGLAADLASVPVTGALKRHNSRLTTASLKFHRIRANFGGGIPTSRLVASVAWRRMQVKRASRLSLLVWAIAFALPPAVFISISSPLAAESPASKPAIANDARVAGDRERTRFIADLSKKVDVHVFALGNPYRVIIDAPDVSFQMPEGIGQQKRGLVTAYRYGLFAPGKARIVIDVSGPFLIDKAFVLEPRDDQPARLVVDLVPTDEKTFQAKLKEAKPPQHPSAAEAAAIPQPPARPADAKPVVVLDPGHGGIDPGTSSPSGITE
jgi:hypothetical protein